MNRRTTIGVIMGAVLLIVAVVLINRLLPKKYNWFERYQTSSGQPYDTDLTLRLLEAFQGEHEVQVVRKDIATVLEDTDAGSYFFIGHFPYYDESSFSRIMEFANDGHTVMIAANSFPSALVDYLQYGYSDSVVFYEEYASYAGEYQIVFPSEEVTIRTPYLEAFTFRYRVKDKYETYDWRALRFENDEGPAPDTLLYLHQHASALGFPLGDGKLILVCNPILLTNLYVSDSNNIAFTEYLFNQLPEADVIWDSWSMSYHYNPETGRYNESEGPLKFILADSSLRAAWYTLLLGLLLFMIFRSKRQQQVIPLTEPNVNRSLEFVQTVARMHYLRKDYLHVMRQQYRVWYRYILDNYQTRNQGERDRFIERLSIRSKVSRDVIEKILDFEERHKARLSLREKEMHEGYNYLNDFYTKCQ